MMMGEMELELGGDDGGFYRSLASLAPRDLSPSEVKSLEVIDVILFNHSKNLFVKVARQC